MNFNKQTTMKALATIIFIPLAFLVTGNISTNTVNIHSHSYRVEIADEHNERMRGLQNREYMAEDHGMLFIFDTAAPQSFWMKDTLIPLDIIFINSDYEVVHIAKATPCAEEDPEQKDCKRYVSFNPAKYVLELNAGQSEKINLKTGDKIQFNIHE